MQVWKLGEAIASLAHLSNSAQVVGHTLVHRVSQWLEVAALQEGLEGPVKHEISFTSSGLASRKSHV